VKTHTPHMYLLVSLLASLALLTQCDNSCRPPTLDLDAESSASLALLQAGVSQARRLARSARLPPLRPVGRSYYSEDPKRSAEWFNRYFGGRSDKSPFAFHEQAAEVSVVAKDADKGPIRIMFVRPQSTTGINDFVETVQDEWQKVMDKEFMYSPWIDFHDGLSWRIMNLSNLHADNVRWQSYNDVNRFIVPGTTWTFELVAINFHENPPVAESLADYGHWMSTRYPDPDKCRNKTDNLDAANTKRMWWKSTYAVKNASAAADFAIQALGAELTYCPYPYPATEGCTGAMWVKIPGPDNEEFDMHFVESFEYPSGNHSIQELHEFVDDKMSVQPGGCFDSSLYNSLVYEADTLDPFLERLDTLKTPYALTKLDDLGKHSLIFAFPGNSAVVVQILGNATKATPQLLKPCD